MGVGEEEVEVDWDVSAQILQKSFLLTEVKQTQENSSWVSVCLFLKTKQSVLLNGLIASFASPVKCRSLNQLDLMMVNDC